MVTFYHGAKTLFDRPDFSIIEDVSGIGRNEYGFGFYASDYGGDAWEYIEGRIASGKPAFVYQMEVDDARYDNHVIVSSKPIGQAMIHRVADQLQKSGYEKTAAAVRETDPHTRGFDFYHALHIGVSPKEKSRLLHAAGIDGYHEGNYMVFFDVKAVPPFQMKQSFNYGSRDAAADLAALQAARTRTPDAAAFADLDGTDFRSEQASAAYYRLKRETGDPVLARMFVDLVEMSKADRDNGGFGIRDKLGYAVQRGFMVEPGQKNEAYFGTNLLNLRQTLAYDFHATASKPEFAAALDAFMDRLNAQPKVAIWTFNAPDTLVTRSQEYKVSLKAGM